MADISVTAANVRPSTDARIFSVTAATTVTAGQLVYKDTTDTNTYRPADASAAASAILAGIAITNASDTETLVVQTSGLVNPGGTVAAGAVYICSSNAGGIAVAADLTSGGFGSIFGIGVSTTEINISITNTSTAKA